MDIPIGKPRRGGWYHGWNIVGASVVSQMCALALTFNCFSLFVVGWTKEFHVPVSAIALAITGFALCCMLTAPVFGIIADRYPARRVFGLALIGLAAAHVAIGFTTSRWQIVVIYAVVLPLVITPASAITGQALVSRWFQRRRGLAMGLTAFGAALAGVIFPPIIVWLLPLVGWRWVWWLFAMLILAVALPLVLLAARDRPSAEEGAGYITAVATEQVAARLSFGEILSRRNFWIIIIAFLSVQGAFIAVSVNMAPFIEAHGHGPGLAAWLLSMMSIAALVSKLGAGILVDYFGNRLPLVLAPLLCGGGLLLMMMAPDNLALLTLGVALLGTAGAAWTLLASATAAEFGAEGFGRAYGVISALTPINTFAPPLLAWMNEASGGYYSGLMVLAGFALFGALQALLLNERSGAGARPGPKVGLGAEPA